MDQMRMDPKHQFAAQYVLQRAATERREREALLAAAMSAGMSAWGNFNMGGMGGLPTNLAHLMARPVVRNLETASRPE